MKRWLLLPLETVVICAFFCAGCSRPIDNKITVHNGETFSAFLKRVSDTLPSEKRGPWHASANEVALAVLATNLNAGKEDNIERFWMIFSESTPREIIRIGAILRIQRMNQGIEQIRERTKHPGDYFLTEQQAQILIEKAKAEANQALKDFQESAKN